MTAAKVRCIGKVLATDECEVSKRLVLCGFLRKAEKPTWQMT